MPDAGSGCGAPAMPDGCAWLQVVAEIMSDGCAPDVAAEGGCAAWPPRGAGALRRAAAAATISLFLAPAAIAFFTAPALLSVPSRNFAVG